MTLQFRRVEYEEKANHHSTSFQSFLYIHLLRLPCWWRSSVHQHWAIRVASQAFLALCTQILKLATVRCEETADEGVGCAPARIATAQAQLLPVDSAALPEAAHTVVSGLLREGEAAAPPPTLTNSSKPLLFSRAFLVSF